MFLALLNAAVYAGIAVIDKRLIDRYVPSLSTYYVCIGVAVLICGLVFLGIAGLLGSDHLGHTTAAAVSGLAWGSALAMMFLGFKLQEVSRASAMVFTFPVFVALFAVVFLGESLSLPQWGAIAVVVLGGILISLTGPATSHSKLTKILPVLLGASLLIAAGHLTAKYALQEVSVSLVTSFHFLGVAFVLLFFWRRHTIPNIRQMMRHREALILLLVAEAVLAPIALLAQIFATKLGPVSLVATLTGTHTAVLSMPRLRVMNESWNRGALLVKSTSVALIVAGIASLGLLTDNVFG